MKKSDYTCHFHIRYISPILTFHIIYTSLYPQHHYEESLVFFQDANALKKVIKSKKIELESGSGRKMSARIRSRRSMHDGKKLSAELAALEVGRCYN